MAPLLCIVQVLDTQNFFAARSLVHTFCGAVQHNCRSCGPALHASRHLVSVEAAIALPPMVSMYAMQATKLVDWGAEGVVVGSALVAKLGEAATPKEGLQAMTELAGRLRDAIA